VKHNFNAGLRKSSLATSFGDYVIQNIGHNASLRNISGTILTNTGTPVMEQSAKQRLDCVNMEDGTNLSNYVMKNGSTCDGNTNMEKKSSNSGTTSNKPNTEKNSLAAQFGDSVNQNIGHNASLKNVARTILTNPGPPGMEQSTKQIFNNVHMEDGIDLKNYIMKNGSTCDGNTDNFFLNITNIEL